MSIILGKKIVKVVYRKTQETLKNLSGFKSVRLDVFAVDSEGNTYNIEIQNENNDSMPRRARFYQGILDVSTLFSGKDFKFKELPKNYVIFIMNFDCYGRDRYQYTFTNRCHEEQGLEFDDDTTKIFLNVNGTVAESTRPELIQFLKLVKDTRQANTGEFAALRELYHVISSLKSDSKREEGYMNAEWQKEKGIEIGEARWVIGTLMDLGFDDAAILGKLKGRFHVDTEKALKLFNDFKNSTITM